MLKRTRRCLLLLALVLLAACGSATPAVTAPPTPSIAPTPTIPAIPARPVHFSTSDHIVLAGLLYGQGKTAVICSHELDTTKDIWTHSGMPQQLAERGYLVLAYDFRGNGDSGGKEDLSTLAVDLQAALAFVREQGATSVVLLGSSMGGTASLVVAARSPVAAVITLSAPEHFIPLTLSDSEVQQVSAPKLFVNSQDDDYVDETRHMYTIASPPKQLHLYPGAAHGTAIFDGDSGANLIQLLLDFIAQYAPAS
jgi:alpha/beta superfamily hydrolase